MSDPCCLHWHLIIRTVATVVLAVSAWSQTPDPQPPGPVPDSQRPPLSPAPAEENWLFLRDPAERVDWLDRLKYIRLGHNAKSYLSLGGEYRGEYERQDGTSFGVGPQDKNGYYLQRFMLHADLHLGAHFRLFSEFLFSDIFDRNGGPRPGVDRDLADIHQLFAEFGTDLDQKDGIRLRVGRQEIVFGTGRLLDNNEGANTKSSFDGARLTWTRSAWEASVFAVKPVEINPGVFDDYPNFRQTLWGIYMTVPTPMPDAKLDMYYLGFDSKRSVYRSGTGPESRNSFGLRLFNRKPGELPSPGVDYNWEAVYQGGSFAGDRIHAWGLATESGYTWRTPIRIRVALRADVASGDAGPSDRTLNTFDPLFPRGAYFGPKFDLIAPYNIYDLHPVIFLHPWQNITATVDAVWFWRQNRHDGVYSFGGLPLQAGTPAQARFIGTQIDLEVRWALTQHVTIALNPAAFLPGRFVQQTTPGRNIAFVNLGLTYRF